MLHLHFIPIHYKLASCSLYSANCIAMLQCVRLKTRNFLRNSFVALRIVILIKIQPLLIAVKIKDIERARIRTWNLLLRRQTRYPLRHAPEVLECFASCKSNNKGTQRFPVILVLLNHLALAFSLGLWPSQNSDV